MSPDAHATSFVPAPVTRLRPEASAAAHAEGYAAGWAAGARAAATAGAAQHERDRLDHERREAGRDAQVSATLTALNAAITHWRNAAAPVLTEAETTLHRASLELAEAVLAREVRPGPLSAAVLLERALALPSSTQPTVLHLSTVDLPHVQRLLERGEAALPTGVSLVADAGLTAGESITEHSTGILDARIGEALARARAALEEDQ